MPGSVSLAKNRQRRRKLIRKGKFDMKKLLKCKSVVTTVLILLVVPVAGAASESKCYEGVTDTVWSCIKNTHHPQANEGESYTGKEEGESISKGEEKVFFGIFPVHWRVDIHYKHNTKTNQLCYSNLRTSPTGVPRDKVWNGIRKTVTTCGGSPQ
jgi:hypothetical protein